MRQSTLAVTSLVTYQPPTNYIEYRRAVQSLVAFGDRGGEALCALSVARVRSVLIITSKSRVTLAN